MSNVQQSMKLHKVIWTYVRVRGIFVNFNTSLSFSNDKHTVFLTLSMGVAAPQIPPKPCLEHVNKTWLGSRIAMFQNVPPYIAWLWAHTSLH